MLWVELPLWGNSSEYPHPYTICFRRENKENIYEEIPLIQLDMTLTVLTGPLNSKSIIILSRDVSMFCALYQQNTNKQNRSPY